MTTDLLKNGPGGGPSQEGDAKRPAPAREGVGNSSLRGVSTEIDGRHAFIHERVLEMIARETEIHGSVTFRKTDLVQRLGCCGRTLDRALTRLRREGDIVSTPVFSPTGAQLGNVYQATEQGIEHATLLKQRRSRRRRAKGDTNPDASASA